MKNLKAISILSSLTLPLVESVLIFLQSLFNITKRKNARNMQPSEDEGLGKTSQSQTFRKGGVKK